MEVSNKSQILRHDLVNAIYALNGHCDNYFDWIKRFALPDDQKLQKAEELIHRMKSQTKGLVLIAKKLEGAGLPRSSADDQSADLFFCWQEALGHAQHEKAKMYAKCVSHIPKDFPQLVCFSEDLIEALGYVAQNALDTVGFDPNGQLIIRSRIESDQDRRVAVIEIVDNGPGILPEQLSKIFEPFYTTKQGQNSGLGLFLAKRLVERNHGKISASSFCGQGAVFRIKLPMSERT